MEFCHRFFDELFTASLKVSQQVKVKQAPEVS